MKQKFVKAGDFVEVLDNSLSKNGVNKGDTLYLAGDFIVSVDENDEYALRRLFIATMVVDGHIQAKGVKPFTIDGKRLTPVSKGKQAKLEAIKNMDFGDGPAEEVLH